MFRDVWATRDGNDVERIWLKERVDKGKYTRQAKEQKDELKRQEEARKDPPPPTLSTPLLNMLGSTQSDPLALRSGLCTTSAEGCLALHVQGPVQPVPHLRIVRWGEPGRDDGSTGATRTPGEGEGATEARRRGAAQGSEEQASHGLGH